MQFVNNLQDFIDYLYSEEGIPDFADVSFQGWPVLDVKIYGERYSGRITPELAKSLYDFYMDLQRAYAFLKYGTSNLQRLTAEDKKIFSSVDFRFEEGCINLFGQFEEPIKSIIDSVKGLTDGMESKDKKHVVIFVGLALAGTITAYTLIDRYFDADLQKHKAEEQRQTIESVIDGNAESLETIRDIVTSSYDRLGDQEKQRLEGAVGQLDSGYRGIVESVPDADKVDFSGVAFDQEDIENIVQRESEETYRDVVVGEFVIDQIRKNRFPVIALRVSSLGGDEEFTVQFRHGDITPESYENIYLSAKNNETVNLRYRATFNSDGDVLRATLLEVGQGRYLSSSVYNGDDQED